MTERTPGFYVGAGSVAGLVIGSFGPWAKVTVFSGASISGVDGSNDGWVILGLAAIAAMALLRQASGNWRGIGVLGVLAFALALYDRSHVQHVAGKSGIITIGWGLNLVLAGSIGLLIAAYVLRGENGELDDDVNDADEYELHCTACEKPTTAGDRFCPHCGAEFDLSSEAPTPAEST